MKIPCVYILASKRNGTLYVGVTSELVQRIWQHKNDVIEGFTKKYGTKLLVYFEVHATMREAIAREKELKKWRRAWKIALIERDNPGWRELYSELAGGSTTSASTWSPSLTVIPDGAQRRSGIHRAWPTRVAAASPNEGDKSA